MAQGPKRRRFGQVQKLRSKRWQARYTVPILHESGRGGTIVTAPRTFEATTFGWEQAGEWLKLEEKRLEAEGADWLPPSERIAAELEARAREAEAAEAARMPLFRDYATRWLEHRRVKGVPLEQSTRRVYNSYLKTHLLPTFGDVAIDAISVAAVLEWYGRMDPKKPKTRKEAYALGKAILATATASDGPMAGRTNPFAIPGAGTRQSPKRTELVTSTELDAIVTTIRPEWRLMPLLAIWCGLRFGELAELRRSDIDLTKRVIRVRRALSSGAAGHYEKAPKSEAGAADQRIPASIVLDLKHHLSAYLTGRDGLVFPGPRGGWLDRSVFYGRPGSRGWYDARDAAGRPDLHFHDLRATGATLLAQNGANIAEVQAFLRDSTPSAAMRYVRAAQSRMGMLTDRLSALAEAGDW